MTFQKHVLVAAAVLVGLQAAAETIRIGGRDVEKPQVERMYDKVKIKYVLSEGQLCPAERIKAFPETVEIEKVIDEYTVLVRTEARSEDRGKAADVPGVSGRLGKEFNVAETNAALVADTSEGGIFAVRLQKKSTKLPFRHFWDLMVCDSKTFIERKKTDGTKVKIRVLYDVTMTFDDFVALLQRGQVFPELAKP